LAARRAITMRELGQSAEGIAATAVAYRLAVSAGDADAVGDVLLASRYPSTDSITDAGRHSEALARMWRGS
ncbi:MAG TPA: hypothetical protein PLV68_03680, partial [Ilumatobacteraceae bacterium]|nr:hypothetical protein [Ilumatobacteraceae bacterium]